jgi:hypothetical protein
MAKTGKSKTSPLAHVMRVELFYRRKTALDWLAGIDDTTQFQIKEIWYAEEVKTGVITALVYGNFYCLRHARAHTKWRDVSERLCIQHRTTKFQHKFGCKFWLRKALIIIKPYPELHIWYTLWNKRQMSPNLGIPFLNRAQNLQAQSIT